MLVLTRRFDQTICLYPYDKVHDFDSLIKIRILGLGGGQVRMGIDAPSNIEVHREEVYEKILLENHLVKSLLP